MSVLCTIFKQAMQDKDGFLSVQEMLQDSCSSHIFKGCLQVKPKEDEKHISQWVAYWEGFPFVIICTVSSAILGNGNLKLMILGKELKPIDEMGEYTAKRNSCFGQIMNGKFVQSKDIVAYVEKNILPGLDKPKKTAQTKQKQVDTVSQSKMDEFKKTIEENWGCKFKK